MSARKQPIGTETVTNVAGAPGFQIRSRITGHAYAKSGNAHNPTPRKVYSLLLDGRVVDCSATAAPLRAAAKAPNARAEYSD